MQLPLAMIQVRQAMGQQDIKLSLQEHVEVAKAILAGNSDEADEAMRRHLRRSGNWLLKLPDTAFRPEH